MSLTVLKFGILRRALFATAAACACAPAAATEEALAANSPFIPADFEPPRERSEQPERPSRPEPPRDLEFRGVYELAGTVKVNIHDRGAGEGHWVRLNDSSADFHVKEFSEADNSIILDADGEATQLVLESSRESPGAPDGSPPETDLPDPQSSPAASARRPPRPRPGAAPASPPQTVSDQPQPAAAQQPDASSPPGQPVGERQAPGEPQEVPPQDGQPQITPEAAHGTQPPQPPEGPEVSAPQQPPEVPEGVQRPEPVDGTPQPPSGEPAQPPGTVEDPAPPPAAEEHRRPVRRVVVPRR